MIRAAAIALLALASAAGAGAGAKEAPRAADDGTGLRLGAFTLRPALEVQARHDNNIFREERDATDSVILRLTPSAVLESDWRRHSAALRAEAEFGLFTASSSDDYADGEVGFEGVLDATRASRLRLRLDARRGHEARGADDALTGLARPVRFFEFGGDLTGQYAPGRVRLQPFVSMRRADFGDAPLIGGGEGDQDDRDRMTLSAGVFAGYRLTRKTELFAEAELHRTDFDDARDRAGLDRDNDGARLLAGVTWKPSDLLEATGAVGWEERSYDDPALTGFSSIIAEGALVWRPRRWLEVEANIERRIEETTIASASGADVVEAGLRARYELTRLIDLTAEAGGERRVFRGAGRRDVTLSLGLGAEWAVRRDTVLSAGLRVVRERSNAPGEDHDARQIWLGAMYRF